MLSLSISTMGQTKTGKVKGVAHCVEATENEAPNSAVPPFAEHFWSFFGFYGRNVAVFIQPPQSHQCCFTAAAEERAVHYLQNRTADKQR